MIAWLRRLFRRSAPAPAAPPPITIAHRVPGEAAPCVSTVIGAVGLCLQVQSADGVRLVTPGQACDRAAFSAAWAAHNKTPLFWASDGEPFTP